MNPTDVADIHRFLHDLNSILTFRVDGGFAPPPGSLPRRQGLAASVQPIAGACYLATQEQTIDDACHFTHRPSASGGRTAGSEHAKLPEWRGMRRLWEAMPPHVDQAAQPMLLQVSKLR